MFIVNKKKILILFAWNIRKIDCNKYFVIFQNKHYISQLIISRNELLDCHVLMSR